MDRWFFQNMVPTLRRLCSRVYAYPLGDTMGNWHFRDWPGLRARLVDRFLSDAEAIAKGPGLDLVLTLVYDDTLRPRDVARLRAMGARVVTYHVDMNAQWYRVLLHAPYLDCLAISHMQNTEPLLRRGVRMHFMPMAASPDRYLTEHDAAAPSPGVLILGSANDSRVRVAAACREATEDVDIYGGGWAKIAEAARGGGRPMAALERFPQPLAKRLFDGRNYLLPRLLAEGKWFWTRFGEQSRAVDRRTLELAAGARIHGPAPDAMVASLLGKARVTMGLGQRRGELGSRFGLADSRLRDFEAPLSGAFYLAQWFVDLPLFYRVGSEVEAWETLEELKEKVKWFLDRPAERAAIAKAGRARAARDHTWDARIRDLFHRLGLAARRGPEPAMCPLDVVANYSSSAWCRGSAGCEPTDEAAAAIESQLAPMLGKSAPN